MVAAVVRNYQNMMSGVDKHDQTRVGLARESLSENEETKQHVTQLGSSKKRLTMRAIVTQEKKARVSSHVPFSPAHRSRSGDEANK